MYFLSDLAEFGRKVSLKKTYPAIHLNDGHRSIINSNSYKGSYTKGRGELGQVIPFDTSLTRLNANGKGIFYQHLTKNGDHVGSNFTGVNNKLDNRKKRNINPNKKGIRLTKEESKKLPSNIKQSNSTPINSVKPQAQKTSPANQNTKIPTSVNTSGKSKYINNYTLGAAGVLGAGLTGLGAYKLLTRKKKEK